MADAEAGSDYEMQNGDPERDEPFHGTSAFRWMGQYQGIPVEAFPTLDGPIVHEGFVPHENDGTDPDNQANFIADWLAPIPSSPLYQSRFTGRVDGQLSDRSPARGPGGPSGRPRSVSRDEDSRDASSDDDEETSVFNDDSQ